MAKQYVHRFYMRGDFEFPIDMLRYDRCTPNTETDSHDIAATYRGIAAVVVELRAVNDNRNWRPTVGRWQSFGWKPYDPDHPEGVPDPNHITVVTEAM
jgi:hypothetical protein